MNLIAAVDLNWGIGKNNDLLYSLPEDMRFFREKTLNKTVLMGRKTLNSFKDGKPLPSRENIVLSRSHQKSSFDNLKYISNLNEIDINTDSIFLIGGASLYAQFFNDCKIAYITKIYCDKIIPDVYFPNLDTMPNWKINDIIQESQSVNGLKYKIIEYYNNLI